MRARAISPDIVIEVFEYMRKHGLALADLAELGGEDLRHPNPAIVKRARAVERTWERMAAAGLRFADLEHFASQPANFRRYPKQLKNQQVTEGGPKPSPESISQQNQPLKKLPPSPRPAQPEKPAIGTALGTNSAQEPILEYRTRNQKGRNLCRRHRSKFYGSKRSRPSATVRPA